LVAIWLILTLFLAYLYKTDNTSEVFDSTLIEEAIEERAPESIPEE
jgi:preprotein translocase subunit SecG